MTLRSIATERAITTLARACADVIAVMAAFAVSYVLYIWAIDIEVLARGAPGPMPYVQVAVLFSVISLLVFHNLDLYGDRATVLNLWELKTAMKGVVVSAAFFLALLFFLKLQTYSRLVVLGGMSLTLVFVVIERRLMAGTLRRRTLLGQNGKRVLICGSGETSRLLMKKIVEAPHLGRRVVGLLDDAATVGSLARCRVTQVGPTLVAVPVLGKLADLRQVVARADELLVAEPTLSGDRLYEILDACRETGVDVGIVPHIGDIRADHVEAEDLSTIPVLRPRDRTVGRAYLASKRAIDVVLGLALAIVTAPLWITAALMIKLGSSGPVFFTQERVGQHGRRFRMFKFRTMYHDCDPYAPSPDGDDDPRITSIGRVLRAGGLDELPQLINVLRGDMSLVGPRPEMPFLTDRYTSLHKERLKVKPGITGLWQLSADRHAEIHENMEYDLYYMNHQSLLLDTLIIVETALFTCSAIARAWRSSGQDVQSNVTALGEPVVSSLNIESEFGRHMEPVERGAAHRSAAKEN